MKMVTYAVTSGVIVSIVMLFLGVLFKMNLYIILIPAFFLLFACGLIFPNIVAKIILLFPKQAGTASAMYGTIISFGVFLMTMFVTLLKTNTQMPMAYTFFGLFVGCLLLFLAMRRLDLQIK
jgi:hypothetical protein